MDEMPSFGEAVQYPLASASSAAMTNPIPHPCFLPACLRVLASAGEILSLETIISIQRRAFIASVSADGNKVGRVVPGALHTSAW